MAEIIDALKEYFGNKVDGDTIDEVVRDATRQGLIPKKEEKVKPSYELIIYNGGPSFTYTARKLVEMMRSGTVPIIRYTKAPTSGNLPRDEYYYPLRTVSANNDTTQFIFVHVDVEDYDLSTSANKLGIRFIIIGNYNNATTSDYRLLAENLVR